METNIIIAGDLCPQERVAHNLELGCYEKIFSEVKPIIESSDYAIVNLEAPIVTRPAKPISKSGPNLKCSPKVVDAIRYIGFKGVTLANNHFYDYGEEGALSTIRELEVNGIDYVGAGKGRLEAAKILFKTINNDTYAFINCCEHEYSIVTNETTGCNPVDVIGLYNAIKEAKKKAKYVIIIVHGGIEMYQLPTPRMVKLYRFFIDAGADVVVNHHQHCYSGYEFHHGKPIVYGVGNFCFDWESKRDKNWKEGYLAKLIFKEDSIALDTIPYLQCDKAPTILLSDIDKASFRHRLKELCDLIVDEKALEKEYDQLLQRTWKNYDMMNPWSNRFLRGLYKYRILPSLMPRKKLYFIWNSIYCESHRERLLNAIQRKMNK